MLRLTLRRCAALVLMAAFGLLALAVPAAQADGTPNISASVTSQRVLHGEAVPVTVTATNPTGQPYGYNLSFRVVLPRGVSYARGGPSDPTVVRNQPTTGQTTLIFSNVSDLSPNSSYDLALELAYDTAVYDVPQTFEVRAQAFINSDPRYVPRFDSRGVPSVPDARSYTGFSTDQTSTTRIVALEIEKDEPSWEGEIMRGVHDQQTVYTLRVDNNLIRATRAVSVVDYLPAGLEFLSCAATPDSTTETSTNPGSPDEYPGSGPIVVGAVADCVTPLTVETVDVDPDGAGPLPRAVYTRVEWSIGNLGVAERRILRYRAAIPIRENTLTWNGTVPTPASGRQAVNLDNNNGPETRDEQELTNYATARGDYASPDDADAEDWLTRTAEDWVVHKEADTDRLVQGGLTWWTLTFETSEYRSVRAATVTDTLPDGLCPLDFRRGNLDGGDPQCAPAAGQFPQDADGNYVPYATAVRNGDGTWSLSWTPTQFPQLAQTDVNQTFTLRFPSRTRTTYPSTGLPILTRDSVTNDVDTEARAVVRCTAPGTPNCTTPGPEIFHDPGYGTGTDLPDASSASQIAADPTIRKLVAQNSDLACNAVAPAVYTDAIASYRPGDEVCWLLRVDFPSGVDTSTQAIRDFLPPGATYVDGSDATYRANTVAATIDTSDRADGMLSWTVDSGTVPRGTEVFEHVIRTRVVPTGSASDFDVLGNLMKFSSVNTPGVSAPLRDQVDIRLITPVVDLVKGVREIRRGGSVVAGPFDPAVDGRNVQAGDEVTYAVEVRNTGPVDAVRVSVWDVLPLEYQCDLGSITGISDSGTCFNDVTPGARDRIEWSGIDIPAGGRVTLTYTARVPLDIGPGRTLPNEAGVTEYFNETNVPGEFFRYEPVDNIDAAREPTANAPAADDPSNVVTTGATLVKDRTTTVTESGNTNAQATIGEFIDYRVTATIPAGTSLDRAGRLTDTLDSTTRQVYDPASASATLDGVALPADGVTLDRGTPTTPPSIAFPDDFDAPSGGADRVVVLTFRVRAADVAGNVRGATLRNDVSLTWRDSDDRDRSRATSVSTTIVEPNLRQAKADDTNPRRVTPGDFVTYTVTTSNPTTGGNVSTAHDVLIEDVVPADVTPVDGAGDPIADGATIPGSAGTPVSALARWDLATRTISKTVTTIASGADHAFGYRVRVNDRIVGGGSLTNTVTSRGNSLPNGTADRRTSAAGIPGYRATATDTLLIQGATVTKTVTPTRATIGDRVAYELTVTVPAGIEIFDTTVEDVVPDAIEFDDYGTVRCDSGCPPFDTAGVGAYRADRSGATTRIAWNLGDVRTDPGEPLVLRLAYSGWVRDRHGNVGAPVVAGETAVNTAVVLSNQENRGTPDPAIDPIPDPAGFRDRSAEARATTTVIEPELGVEKVVRVNSGAYGETGTAQPGDALSYQLTVRNDGDNDAYDAVVVDTPDADVTGIVLGTPSAGTARVVGATIEWAIAGPIAPGASVTLTYTARLVDSSQLRAGDRAENTVDLTEYWGVPRATREDPTNGDIDYRRYVGGTDVTDVDLDFPAIDLEKTTGLAGDPDTGDVLVGQEFPWRVVVRNTATVASASDVTISDTLPPNWSYVADSAAIDGAAMPPTRIDRAATGDRLTWTIPAFIPAGGQRVLTFRATPSAAAVSDPGLGVEANVNTASAAARDGSGATGNEDGPYESGPDTATATLVVPDLAIDKTPDGGAAVAGEGSTFRIAVENTGPTDARGLAIRDVLPDGVRYTAGSATANPATGFTETAPVPGPGTGETTVVWNVATLAPGARVEITVPVTVDADVLDGTTLVNRASVTSDELSIPISDTGDLVVDAETDMAIVKTGPARYVAGTDLTWSLRVTNNGPSDAQDVVIADVLPAGTSFVSADAPCTFAVGAVRCALGTVAAGADRTFAITVRTDPGLTADPLENTATVTTTTTDTDPGNDASRHDATPDALADVSIVKTATPEQIHSGGQSTFALTVVNHGPSVARDVEVTDVLPSGLGFVSVDNPACAEASGTVTCALGDLAVDAPVAIAITVQSIEDGTWENTASVTTTTREPSDGGQPNRDSATVTSAPVADLGIVKSGPATAVAGQDVAWTLVVTNHGPNPATGVTVVDDLPQGVTFASAAPSQGACAPAGSQVRCELGGLEPGASAQIQVVGRLAADLGATTVVNHAAVSGAEHDPNPANDRAEAPTRVDPAPAPPRRDTPPPPPSGFDLALDKRVRGNAVPVVGRPFTYDLTVVNAGPAAANGVVVTDTLPSAVRGLSARVAGGRTCSIRGAVVRCELGTLAAGARASVAIRVRPLRAGRAVRNNATVSASAADLNPSNDRASVTTRITAARAVLRLSKTTLERGPVAPGETARYRVRVTNASRNAATSVVVCDRLPDSVSLVSSKGARLRRGSVCWEVGMLAARRSRTFTLTVRVHGDVRSQTIRNRAVVTAGNAASRSAQAFVTVTAPGGGSLPQTGRGGGVTG